MFKVKSEEVMKKTLTYLVSNRTACVDKFRSVFQLQPQDCLYIEYEVQDNFEVVAIFHKKNANDSRYEPLLDWQFVQPLNEWVEEMVTHESASEQAWDDFLSQRERALQSWFVDCWRDAPGTVDLPVYFAFSDAPTKLDLRTGRTVSSEDVENTYPQDFGLGGSGDGLKFACPRCGVDNPTRVDNSIVMAGDKQACVVCHVQLDWSFHRDEDGSPHWSVKVVE